MKNRIYLLLACFLCAGFSSFAQKTVDLSQLIFEETETNAVIYKQFTAETVLSIQTATDQRISLDLGAGSAKLYQSVDNKLRVEAEIVLTLKNEKKIGAELKDLELYIAEKGDEVKLVSTFDYNDDDENAAGGFFSSPERKINLKIYVPKDLPLKVVDRSGDISIKDLINNLALTDGSGAITIDGLEGSLNLIDHSGGIDIKNINRQQTELLDISIKDYSGGLYVKDVKGNTKIVDASGEIVVNNLIGELSIRDNSGGIRVKNVQGETKVSDSSGEVRLVGIDGNVIISDSSGGIHVEDVSQDVTVKRDGSGSFTTKNIGGSIVKKG